MAHAAQLAHRETSLPMSRRFLWPSFDEIYTNEIVLDGAVKDSTVKKKQIPAQGIEMLDCSDEIKNLSAINLRENNC